MYLNKWTQHLTDPADKANFERKLKSYSEIFERLTELLNEKEQELDNNRSISSYSSPAWPYLQADTNGSERALKFVKRLIDLKEKE